ncbi:MAG: hypothetical protein QOF86_1749 [Baekduia sp.]|nr:hypothetical protein [Baekduia sp.]
MQRRLPPTRGRRTVDGVRWWLPARVRELALPAEERRIERAVRKFRRELRREIDNSPERRAAARDAEIWRALGSGFGYARRR